MPADPNIPDYFAPPVEAPVGGDPSSVPDGVYATPVTEPPGGMNPEDWLIVALGAVVLAALGVWFMLVMPGVRYRQVARHAGLELSLFRAIRLALRGAESERLLHLWSKLHEANIREVTFDHVLKHHRAGGRVADVVDALLHAHRCQVRFDWAVLCRFDLEGKDPSPIVDKAVKPWRLTIPGVLLGGEALPAMAGDGVELRITGEAEVVAAPDGEHPLPHAAAMVANIAKVIVGYVHGCHCHRTLLQQPIRLSDAVNAADLAHGTALRLLRFTLTRIERGGSDVDADPADAIDASRKLDKLLADQPIDQMSADELAASGAAYVQFGDYAAAQRVCEMALTRDPVHERASMWLHEAMHRAGAPLGEQLALAGRCIEQGVEPRAAWRLIRASIICRMATETDPATGHSRVIDGALYKRAVDEVHELSALDDRLVEHADERGWIDDWRSAFPGLGEELVGRASTARNDN